MWSLSVPRCLLEDYDRFVAKYPFTKEAKQRISDYCIEDVLRDEQFVNKLVKFVEDVLRTGKVDASLADKEGVETWLLMHYAALLVVSQLPKRAWMRFADAESKYFSDNLSQEVDRECVLYVAKQFGLTVYKTTEISICEKLKYYFDIAVPVWTYLKFMPRNDPNWKLINKYVAKGYVLLHYNDLVRLVEEAVEKHILKMLENLSENVMIGELVRSSLSEKFEKLYRKFAAAGVSASGASSGGPPVRGKYPPCIEQIINEIRSGGNPSHMARFTVAAFLLHVLIEYEGKTVEEAVEEVVNLFRTVADFDERKTRYQVMHIAGLVGGRKFYMPPNCDELISLGLCPVNGACGVKNPLVAYARSLRRTRRRSSQESEEQKQQQSTAQDQEHIQDKSGA